jgi:uncharacterized protein (TIGR02271 family)
VSQAHLSTDFSTSREPERNVSPMENLDNSDLVIPLLREELEIRKELVDTGSVRLTKSVSEKPILISELIASEYVEVERIPRDEIVSVIPSIRTEGNVTIIPVVEEVVIVSRQLRLKEELWVTKKQTMSEYREEAIVRSEELTVERFSNRKSD